MQELVDMLQISRDAPFAAEAWLYGQFSCQNLVGEVDALVPSLTAKTLCTEDDRGKRLFIADEQVWSPQDVSKFFAGLASNLETSQMVFAVLSPADLEFDQARNAFRASVEILKNPSNPYDLAQVNPTTGTLLPLLDPRLPKPKAFLDPKAAWVTGDRRLAGFLLTETVNSVEDLQGWLLPLVDRCLLWSDVEEIAVLREILADRSRWGESKSAFSALRGLTLAEGAKKPPAPAGQRSAAGNLYAFCELVAKLTYSLTWPIDPFDRDSGHFIGSAFAATAKAYGAEDWEHLLFP